MNALFTYLVFIKIKCALIKVPHESLKMRIGLIPCLFARTPQASSRKSQGAGIIN